MAGFFLLLAVSVFFHKEIFRQTFERGEVCGYLPEGAYLLSAEYVGAPGESALTLIANSLVTSENKQGMPLVAETLPAGDGELRVMVDAPTEARNVYLSSEYVTTWTLQSVKLSNYDNYFLAFLFFLLAAGILVYGALFYQKEHHVILMLIGVGVLSSFPLFAQHFPYSEDMLFHFARINGIYEGLRTGQFPVRINPVQLGGYGYITGTMYPQLFLYIPAFLKWFHVSTLLGVQMLIFAANLAAPLFAYESIRRICRDDRIGFLAAAFYGLSPYRLLNFYSRGALGEGLAMAFLPLILWGTYEILWNQRKRWWILMLGMSGVLGSHLLSVELYAALILGEMILWGFSKKRSESAGRLLAMGKAVLGTVCLNLYFLGPFLSFSKLKPACFSLVSREDLYTVDPMRAFEPFAQWGNVYQSLGQPALMSVTLGCVALAGVCLFGCFLLWGEKDGQDDRTDRTVAAGKRFLVLGSLFFGVSLWVIPWETLLEFKWVYRTLGALQFPWRTFGVSALLFSVVTAAAVTIWERVGQRTAYRCLWAILLGAALLECGGYFGNVAHSAEMMGKKEAESSNYTDYLYLCENSLLLYYYTPDFSHISSDIEEHLKWLNVQNTGIGVVCGEPEDITWTNYRRDGLCISADVSSEVDFYAAFPLHSYPGYRVLVDGEEAESYSLYSFLTCDLTKGTHHVEVEWRMPFFFRACDALSICVAAALMGWWIFRCVRGTGR